jgi:hypothetical protein
VVVPDRDALEAVTSRMAGRGIRVTETASGVVVHDLDEIEVRVRTEGTTP